ncbi:unnamed protein product [Rotaria socialis]|uniref:Uncharacterized protein n=1 Tax=Rotaria socialis TaxID=392032 RepID=A0A818QC95_9BILA|nr:unnamed protein product [Rotaria socialis]CAF3698580.1 unnamed protein product [Rotaria socialis]
MSSKQWTLLYTAQSYEEAKDLAKSRFNVCQNRRSDLNDQTKYSFKCSEYRKYSLCYFQIKIIVPDNNMNSITIMSKNEHEHEQNERNATTRLPSPIRESISTYVSVLFDYIPTPSLIIQTTDQSCRLPDKRLPVNLKLIEPSNDSTLIIGSPDKLINSDQLQQNNETNDKLNSAKANSNFDNNNRSRRTDRSISSNRRAFALYPNCLSDWDSTDSESGTNELNPNDELETCQTRC